MRFQPSIKIRHNRYCSALVYGQLILNPIGLAGLGSGNTFGTPTDDIEGETDYLALVLIWELMKKSNFKTKICNIGLLGYETTPNGICTDPTDFR